MQPYPILEDVCYREGRGPELHSLLYANNGKSLVGAEYFNPDDAHDPANVKRLQFIKRQVFMLTPEEVCNAFITYPTQAAVMCLGRSAWLQSFAPQHLAACQHFQIMFYDQYLDVICEDVIYEPRP